VKKAKNQELYTVLYVDSHTVGASGSLRSILSFFRDCLCLCILYALSSVPAVLASPRLFSITWLMLRTAPSRAAHDREYDRTGSASGAWHWCQRYLFVCGSYVCVALAAESQSMSIPP
jgi:hypothetical protein